MLITIYLCTMRIDYNIALLYNHVSGGKVGTKKHIPSHHMEGGAEMPISKAQQKANTKYVKNNYDTIITRIDKGKKADLQSHAAALGESLNGFVNRAIDEAVERDTGSSPANG